MVERSSTFVIRLPRRSRAKAGHPSFARQRAFTILELLIVISIIIILAGLTIATMGYVQRKGGRSRAEAEIAAMSAAMESYKADNGVYPRDSANNTTDTLNARQHIDATQQVYQDASLYLFTQLSGLKSDQTALAGAKSYFNFKPQMLGGSRDTNGNVNPVKFLRDPFGNSYGYSTAYQKDPATGYNPTFDLWSTADPTPTPSVAPTPTPQDHWIKNW
jgi:type II secretory pathway pseudopilin PulG